MTTMIVVPIHVEVQAGDSRAALALGASCITALATELCKNHRYSPTQFLEKIIKMLEAEGEAGTDTRRQE